MFGTTLWGMDRLSIGTYDSTDLGSTHGTADGKFDNLLLVDSLWSVDET